MRREATLSPKGLRASGAKSAFDSSGSLAPWNRLGDVRRCYFLSRHAALIISFWRTFLAGSARTSTSYASKTLQRQGEVPDQCRIASWAQSGDLS